MTVKNGGVKGPTLHDVDLELVRRLHAGRAEAFAEFCALYLPRLYRYCLARLDNNYDLSQEVVQETVRRAFEHLKQYRGEASLTSWLFSICRNEIYASYKKAKRQPISKGTLDDLEVLATLESLSRDPETPETRLRQKEVADRVHIVLDYLPEHYGQVLEWKYVEGLPVRQIAERLQVRRVAAESLLARARRAFREGYDALGEPVPPFGPRLAPTD